MAGVSVKFRATDEISTRFDEMVSAGSKALDTFDQLESAANSSYGTMADGAESAARAIDKAASATDYWTDKVGNYDKEAMQAVWSTEELVEMGYMTEDALKQSSDAVEDAADAVEKYGEESEEAAKKSEKFGDESKNAIVSLEDVLTTAGIAVAVKKIAEAFSDASQSAAEFEVSVAKLTTVADTAVLSADELSAQINEVSMETAQNVNALADSAYNAISAGVDTANALDTVTNATELAAAGFTSTESALSVLTTAMNAYHLEASQLTNVSDSLIMSQNLGVMTIDQLSSSMGKAIATASAYSVDLYNLEASYISTTKAGISVEESTTYLSGMFNELGKSSSEVAKIIQDETGKSFGELMQEGYNVADVLDILCQSVNGNTEALMNLWGSAEAGKAANAIVSQGLETFASNLDAVKYSAGTTATAYETMTNTAEYATQRLENSAHNMQIAIGEDINPVVAELKNGFADLLDGTTELIKEHPAITAVLTGATVGIGAVTVAITGYTAVTKIAAVASTALGTSMTVALGPLGLAAAAIGAVTAAVIYMANQEDDAVRAQGALTSSSQAMADELEDLQKQYDAMAEAGEADTVAAYQLKNQIDELTYSLEENGRTIGDLINESEQLGNVIDEMTQSYDDSMDSINRSESDSKSLIAQLAAMQEGSELTGTQLSIMSNIVDQLNGSYEGLNLTMDETNGKLNMSVEDLWSAVSDAAEQEKAQANMDALMDYIGQYQEAQSLYDEALQTQAEKKAAYDEAMSDGSFAKDHPILAFTGWAEGAEMNWSGKIKDTYDEYKAAQEATEAAGDNFDDLTDKIEACYEAMGYSQNEIDDMMAELALASATATDAANSMEQLGQQSESVSDGYDEAKTVIGDFSERLQQLCEDYDAAYQAALDSIQGQYSLWETADSVVAMSQSNIEKALQSQTDYWTNYNTNLESLTEKASEIEGLSDMLADLADGSSDSASMLAGLAKMNDADLSAVVQQYTNLQEAQSETATSVAELETDFAENMDNIQADMEDMIGSMNMSDEAAANAKKTMDAYVSVIETGVSNAQKAIDSLNFANNTLKGGGFHEYATGTTDAEPGLALVGEDGPELVNFSGGEVVYTAPETAEILAKDTEDRTLFTPPSEESSGSEYDSGDKTITLRIEGAGEMKVGGSSGVSKEDVVSILIENVKDALMNILQQEILEEGDMSYEF